MLRQHDSQKQEMRLIAYRMKEDTDIIGEVSYRQDLGLEVRTLRFMKMIHGKVLFGFQKIWCNFLFFLIY